MEEKSNSRIQWEKLKGQPFSEKLRYVLEYYGIWVGAVAFIILLGFFALIFSADKGRPNLASGIIFDIDATDENHAVSDPVCEILDKDPDGYQIEFYPIMFGQDDPVQTYDEQEAIFARITAGDLDFFVGTSQMLLTYMDASSPDYCSIYMLDEVLPDEILDALTEQGRVYEAHTNFRGDAPFLVNISDSYISEGLGVKKENLYLAWVSTSKKTDVFRAMCELLIE